MLFIIVLHDILQFCKSPWKIFWSSDIKKYSDSDKLWTKWSINRLTSSLQVYLSLLRMYLSPPDVHCLGPINMELSEPQANLQAALHVLELHHSKLNTTKVNNNRAALHSSPGWLKNKLQSINTHIKWFYFYLLGVQHMFTALKLCQWSCQSQTSTLTFVRSLLMHKILALKFNFPTRRTPSATSNCSLYQKARISF